MSGIRKHISIGKWLNNNKFVAVLSLVLALVIWLVVALQMSNQMEATFSEIPVTIDTKMPDKLDLKMFGQTDLRVSVTVSGKRYEISPAVLSGEDFVVTASTANVSSAGKHTLPITVRPKDANTDVQIVSFTPESVDVYFDYNLTENYPVEVQLSAPGDQVASDGFIEDDPIVSTAEVTISGAAAEVQKIARVIAKVTLDEPLSETTKFENTALAIVNANGGIVRSAYVRVEDSITDVTVTVPILKVTQIRPSVRFKNSPSYFLDHPISYICSPSGTVKAGVATELLGSTDSLSLGTIDFSAIKSGTNSFEFASDSIENVRVLDDVESFRVYFSVDGFRTRKIAVSTDSAAFSALPEGIRAAIPEDTIEVTVIGLPDEIEALTPQDFTLSVDVAALTDTPGTVELPLTVSVNNTASCWVYGSYTVNVVVS